jgi:glycosyltransferase involved in cell wall biosynthesis
VATFTPFVSIVIPTRNRADKLRVCLESLLAQDHPAGTYEIIVANDGSTDDTAAVAESFGPRVKLVRPVGRGSNAARNAGAAAARGNPICFLDDDVEAEPGWLAAIAAGAARHPDADAYGGPVRLRLEGTTREVCAQHPFVSSYDFGDADVVVDVALGANMAVPRRTFDRIGLFDEWIQIGGADTEWFFRLQRAGGSVQYLAGAAVWHRRTARDLRPTRFVRENFRRGAASHRFLIRLGARRRWRDSARMARVQLRAARRERCLGALGAAALQAGFAYGLLRHPRVRPPPRRAE